MTKTVWQKLMARVRHHHKLRDELGDHDSHIDDIIRPKGMRRKSYRSKLDRLRRVEQDIERLGGDIFKPKE